MTDTTYTPPAVARRYRVHPMKVLQWIHRGELVAINIAERADGRPRWRIRPEDLALFELQRQAVPEVKPQRRARRNRRDPGFVEFF